MSGRSLWNDDNHWIILYESGDHPPLSGHIHRPNFLNNSEKVEEGQLDQEESGKRTTRVKTDTKL